MARDAKSVLMDMIFLDFEFKSRNGYFTWKRVDEQIARSAALEKQQVANCFRRRQFFQTSIECNENSIMFHRVAEQEGIGPLSVASDCKGECVQAGRKIMIQWPEFVAWVTGCFVQYLQGARGTHGALCNVGVRQQAEHA